MNLSAWRQSRGGADVEACRSRNWLHVIWWGTGSSLAFNTGVRNSARDAFDRRWAAPPAPHRLSPPGRGNYRAAVCSGDVAARPLSLPLHDNYCTHYIPVDGTKLCDAQSQIKLYENYWGEFLKFIKINAPSQNPPHSLYLKVNFGSNSHCVNKVTSKKYYIVMTNENFCSLKI